MGFLKLDGDKACLVHWDPLQSGELSSYCPLPLKSVWFFGVLLVNLRMNLVGWLGWFSCSMSGNGVVQYRFSSFCCSLAVEYAYRGNLRLCDRRSFALYRTGMLTLMIIMSHCLQLNLDLYLYRNGDTDVLAKSGRVSCPLTNRLDTLTARGLHCLRPSSVLSSYLSAS